MSKPICPKSQPFSGRLTYTPMGYISLIMDHDHSHHQRQLPRLNRIAGQVEGVKKMIEAGRHCPDILTQLRAIRAALRTVEADILEGHLHSCVSTSLLEGDAESARRQIDEIKDLFKRFDSP